MARERTQLTASLLHHWICRAALSTDRMGELAQGHSLLRVISIISFSSCGVRRALHTISPQKTSRPRINFLPYSVLKDERQDLQNCDGSVTKSSMESFMELVEKTKIFQSRTGQMLSVNLLGLVSHSFCHNLSALPSLQECSHRQHRNRRAWQCSSKNVFTKRGEGPCHPCFAKPCFGGMVSPEIIQPNV